MRHRSSLRGRNRFGHVGLGKLLNNSPRLFAFGFSELAPLRRVRRGHGVGHLCIGTERVFVPFLPTNLYRTKIRGKFGQTIWVHGWVTRGR